MFARFLAAYAKSYYMPKSKEQEEKENADAQSSSSPGKLPETKDEPGKVTDTTGTTNVLPSTSKSLTKRWVFILSRITGCGLFSIDFLSP